MDRQAAEALLGVLPNVSLSDLKIAYRTAAKTRHPDGGGNEADFLALRQAFDVLEKSLQSGVADIAIPRTGYRKGVDVHVNIVVPLETIMDGGPAQVPGYGPCTPCDATGVSGSVGECTACGGTGRGYITKGILRLRVDCPRCGGGGQEPAVRCTSCEGTGTRQSGTISFDVRPGMAEGELVTLEGKGAPGAEGGPAGDLVARVTSARHPAVVRSESDLLTSAWVSFAELCLGGETIVTTLGSRSVKVSFPAGTRAGAVVRVIGAGLPGPTGIGALAVRLWPRVPQSLTYGQRELLERWSYLERGILA